MPRKAEGLSAGKVQKAGPGRYGHGNGLYLLVRSKEARFWIFRYVRNGRRREMGLGPAAGVGAVSLSTAEDKAYDLRQQLKSGIDPLAKKREERAAQQAEAAKGVTFGECADRYLEAHRDEWKNEKHRQQWENTLRDYAAPVLGKQPVHAVDRALVLEVLKPIWKDKTETAVRLRGRIESILDWARAAGYRSGENPARWKGGLKDLLANPTKLRQREHHAALPYDEMPAFMAKLRAEEGTPARALEFLILTASRTNEVIGARWSEFRLKDKLWVIPGARMKSGKPHRVPLSQRALQILNAMKPDSDEAGAYVFPGRATGQPLSNMAFLMLLRRMERGDLTTHGFRSSFRDWAAEQTNYPNELAEMALAHAVGDKVEAAYRRGDMLQKRHHLAADWAAFCAKPPRKKGDAVVVPIRQRKAKG